MRLKKKKKATYLRLENADFLHFQIIIFKKIQYQIIYFLRFDLKSQCQTHSKHNYIYLFILCEFNLVVKFPISVIKTLILKVYQIRPLN